MSSQDNPICKENRNPIENMSKDSNKDPQNQHKTPQKNTKSKHHQNTTPKKRSQINLFSKQPLGNHPPKKSYPEEKKGSPGLTGTLDRLDAWVIRLGELVSSKDVDSRSLERKKEQ